MKLHMHFLNSLSDFGKLQYGCVEFLPYHYLHYAALLSGQTKSVAVNISSHQRVNSEQNSSAEENYDSPTLGNDVSADTIP